MQSVIEQLFGVAGKSVLVTGGSRGIGKAIAEAFVKAGARVYICSRDAEKCDAAARDLQQFGTCVSLPCNIASAEDRQRLVRQLKEHETALNVLINNAGAIWAAPLEEYPESGWDKVFDLNVKGTFFLVKDLVALLSAGGSAEDPARIINVGSIDGFHVPGHETYAYSSSKAALHHLTRHFASQLAARHVTANIIAPGVFPSKMLAATLETKGMDAMVEPVPLKRLTGDSDMAGAAIYLASKAGAYVTGAVIPVDGGMATTL
ncbi:SDR family oxidoreductase [Paraburkholderia unamae]|uniref:NAD(P)-dependent dehydrogenase (Short-subunit alcohol dehydrogenase family) n=1 Tax=Paraburkholderia unamae TaxID=219649 RepID=A0ABX5K9S2_9BURK|nr:SDR family oxidoreductase [Paraburkholderia unamae]PVX71606.1 NAD(P)-dependent dehydrogenase (short-subunit alcohol dehydrogenase family) [Paraburkholderia unamae]